MTNNEILFKRISEIIDILPADSHEFRIDKANSDIVRLANELKEHYKRISYFRAIIRKLQPFHDSELIIRSFAPNVKEPLEYKKSLFRFEGDTVDKIATKLAHEELEKLLACWSQIKTSTSQFFDSFDAIVKEFNEQSQPKSLEI